MPDHREGPSLPDYESPPVVETVLGVQFNPLPKFRNAHLGAFWKSLDQSEWSIVADATPRSPQFEEFGEAKWAKAEWRFMFTKSHVARLQIRNSRGDRMIQVQHDRLHFNWLRRTGEAYPRYPSVRDGFEKVLEDFLRFVQQEQLGEFRPNQWEVTYLNHIPKGSVWTTPADWNFFRPLDGMPTIDGVIEAERFGGEWHFVIPPQLGRLHVNWQHEARSVAGGNEEIIRLTLTARGPMPDAGDEPWPTVSQGLDLGRRTIVCAFAQLMSPEANKYWGLKHAGD